MSTHEHLEHAEHAQHAAHDPFQARVAITMAMIAALLAAVTLLSHRAHNDTLQAQIEASILQNQASDAWNFFQAKNIRDHEYEAYIPILDAVAKAPGQDEVVTKTHDYWVSQRDKYKTDLPKLNEQAKGLEDASKVKQHESHFHHEQGTRYDLGEICIDVGLVICSIALLTKKRSFWFTGMAAAALGATIAASAFFIAPHTEGHDGPATEHHATEKAHDH